MTHHLQSLGVKNGSIVLQWSRNSLEWVLIDLACSSLNAIHAPLDARMSPTVAEDIVAAIRPAAVFVDAHVPLLKHSRRIPSYRELPSHSCLQIMDASFKSTDGANLLFTSGTTNQPRAVLLSHQNLVSNAISKLDAMPQRETDHRLNLLPFAHAYARTCELTTWLLSGSSLETVHGTEAFIDRLAAARPTLVNAVPAVYENLASRWNDRGDSPTDILQGFGGSIRQLASGGAPISESARLRFHNAGLDIYQGYGLTEAGPVVCSNRAATDTSPPVLAGVGPPVSNTEVKIDTHGRLWVRGTGVMSGYWQDSSATEARIVDGWLDTQDRAEFDNDGRALRILGRMDDVIVLQNGYKLNPFPIEARVLELPWVEDCFLFGSGRKTCVLIIKPRSGASLPTLDAVCEALTTLLPNDASRAIRVVQFSSEPWSAANGLCNFKGGKRRRELEQFYTLLLAKEKTA
jgi:long-chain acyl-CoA synthetase